MVSVRAFSKPKLGERRKLVHAAWPSPCPHALVAVRAVAAQKRPSRLNVCFQSWSRSALQHCQITSLRQASQCMLLVEKTRVIGSQILWERQGTLILSCPKNNMGTLHPHVGIPGTDMQPLIILWPVSHLREFMYSKKFWFHLLGHTIPGKKQVPV